MTALAGFWTWRSHAEPLASCNRVLAAQKLYGQHGTNTAQSGPIALGRNLHRLLPEDDFDRQPVRGRSGDLLVADLRLDNRQELLRGLGLSATDANLLSDSELLSRSLERWDEAALDRIVGDFAFAHWDPRRERLLLARDFLGQRPLVYHRGESHFAFASMAKGLHALPDIAYAPDRQMVAEFSALLPECGSRTFFEGIHKVEPGHTVVVRRGEIHSRKYFNPSTIPLRLKSADEYAEALRDHLDEAVAARLRFRGNAAAAQLSGGLDSSVVTATAAQLLATGGRGVVAFTAVPREGYSESFRGDVIGDEGELAAATARLHTNIEHVRIRTADQSPLASLGRNFFLYERPILNICNWTWEGAIGAAAGDRGLSVMLSGRIGNLGLSWGGMDLLPALLKSGRLSQLARNVAGLRRGGTRWGTIGSQILGPFLPRPLWGMVRGLRGLGRDLGSRTMINPAAADGLGIVERAREEALDLSYRPPIDGAAARLQALGRVDFGNYNKGALAEWGIDYRDPTADRRLIEFCLRVPAEEFLRGGVTRSLARRAFADRLPAEVVGERRRGYQAADWHEGFDAARDEIRAEVERIAACPAAAQVLNIDRMRALVADWPTGGWNRPETMVAYRVALLRAISNGHFLRKASGSNY